MQKRFSAEASRVQSWKCW